MSVPRALGDQSHDAGDCRLAAGGGALDRVTPDVPWACSIGGRHHMVISIGRPSLRGPAWRTHDRPIASSETADSDWHRETRSRSFNPLSPSSSRSRRTCRMGYPLFSPRDPARRAPLGRNRPKPDAGHASSRRPHSRTCELAGGALLVSPPLWTPPQLSNLQHSADLTILTRWADLQEFLTTAVELHLTFASTLGIKVT